MELSPTLSAYFLSYSEDNLFFAGTQTGMKITKAMIENNNPPMVPTAKANQNTSLLPSKRNGINPKMVERIVNRIGIILWLYALI